LKIFLYICLLNIVLFSQINFIHDIKQAYKIANKSNKLIYLLLTTPGCPWCYRMENIVLKNSDIQNSLQVGYIGIILQNKKHHIPKQNKVTFYPTSMIIDPKDKHILSNIPGYIGVKSLNKTLNNTHELYKKD